MLAKPFNLILVYIVTIFNVMILASPLIAALAPFLEIKNNVISLDHSIAQKLLLAIFILAFWISFLMLIYLFFDLLLGFSVKSSLKNCQRYEKIKDFDFLTPVFDQVKDKFDQRGVKLYIKNSDEINAFAVSSLGRKAIVLTRGLISHYLKHCRDSKEFLYALRSIMGHEMSHLINKDFLPSFLIMTNQKVTNFSSNILFLFFRMGSRIVNYVPHGGYMVRIMNNTYWAINVVITLFNRLIVYNLYEFLRRLTSRSIEYRCDYQSARAFGGQNMAFALSMLGSNGYFTLFSTHPRTKARMKKVANVKISDSIIRPRLMDALANCLSLVFLLIICLYFAKQAKIDIILREYIRNHDSIHQKLSNLWQLIHVFIK